MLKYILRKKDKRLKNMCNLMTHIFPIMFIK
jgi:hypothetical protein